MASPIAGGVLRATKTIDSSILVPYTTPVPTIEITFDAAVTIVSGQVYAVVASAPGATGATFDTGIGWRFWSEAGGYTGGGALKSTNSGGTWAAYGDTSQYFHYITKASAVEKDKGPLTGGSSSIYFGNTTWYAQPFTAASSYSLTSIVLQMHKGALVVAGNLTIDLYGPAAYVFTPPSAGPTKKRLIAAANNKIWYEMTA